MLKLEQEINRAQPGKAIRGVSLVRRSGILSRIRGVKGILTITGVMMMVLFFSRCSPQESDPSPETVEQLQPELPPAEESPSYYGISLDSCNMETGVIGRNETLADLLLKYEISMNQIYQISLLPDSLLDERRMKRGNRYAFFTPLDTDSMAEVSYFVYEKDAQQYVTVGIAPDSVWAQNSSKPVVTRWQVASGTIETSLWESMLDQGVNPMLAIELSEIFAWSIDFFGIQRGDRYKVIYQESYVDSQSIGISKISGAWFYHNQVEFWAIPFIQDGERSYFDEKGNSLEKAFLKAPLRYSRISSGFSNSRYHPVLKIRRPHHGVDYAAPAGTPVHTVGDGRVTAVGYQKNGGGNYVKIKHNSVYSTTYMHLSRFGKGIRQGVYVKQGDVIGYVGSTGLATGPHLDFRFYRNGSAVNPLRVEAPPVEPVKQDNIAAFSVVRALTMQSLKLIE
jgi:murein DD-endopeptidase MepM/ murein hydrolase activator NlpD